MSSIARLIRNWFVEGINAELVALKSFVHDTYAKIDTRLDYVESMRFIGVLRMAPGDVLVMRFNRRLSEDVLKKMQDSLARVVGRNKVMIIDDADCEMDVIRMPASEEEIA